MFPSLSSNTLRCYRGAQDHLRVAKAVLPSQPDINKNHIITFAIMSYEKYAEYFFFFRSLDVICIFITPDAH